MPNIIADGSTKQHWMPNFQRKLEKRLVSKSIATLYTGPDRILNNPFNSRPASSDGAAQTTYSVADFTTFNESLTVNRRAVAAEHIDNIEQLQVRYDLAKARSEAHAIEVADKIDQYMLSLPSTVSGVTTLDAALVGGSAGTAITGSSTNIDDVANGIRTELMLSNADDGSLYWVVSPFEAQHITGFSQGAGFDVADYSIKNGFTGREFGGLSIIISNNLPHRAVLAMATQPSAAETVTVAGVTFTFVSSVGSTPGNVLIGANVDATRLNLAAAINGSAGAGTTYVEVSEVNRRRLQRAKVVATDSAAADTLTIDANQTLRVAETLAAGGNAWGAVTRRTVAGVKGAIYGAVPTDGAEYHKKQVSGKHGHELETSQIYQGTIWEETKPAVFSVWIA